jgi:hypothetical protein
LCFYFIFILRVYKDRDDAGLDGIGLMGLDWIDGIGLVGMDWIGLIGLNWIDWIELD